MGILSKILLIFCFIQTFAWADTGKKADIYLMGIEQFESTEIGSGAKQYPSTMVFSAMESKSGNSSKGKKIVVRKTTAAESSENLKQTLQSFQDAIKDLCISQVELSLAFSASANAWVVVNGEVSASAKVIIKNSNEKCK